MKLRLYKIIYLFLFLVFGIIAFGFGIFCFKHDCLEQGLFVICSFFAFLFSIFLLRIVNENIFRKMSFSLAGHIVMVLDCKYYDKKNNQENQCKLYLCENNILIDTKRMYLKSIDHYYIDNFGISRNSISFMFNDDKYKFICNSELALKAAEKYFNGHSSVFIAS